MATANLTCCVCGGPAGRYKQHSNRDIGYGICASCAAEEAGILSKEQHQSLYGLPGINYPQPMVRHMGRRYKCLAVFPATEAGQKAANRYMEANPNAGVLCVSDGIYLTDILDLGEPINEA